MSKEADTVRSSGGPWDPRQYGRFADHRLRPALELLARISHPAPRLAYDLGCGTGEIPRLMSERWPEATVVGLDSSPEMLAKAAAEPSRVLWEQADLSAWSPPASPDLIYSNAALHWIEGHEELFPRLLGLLTPGGQLAVQMPLSWPEPSHQLLRRTLDELGIGTPGLRRSVARRWVMDADFYYDLLRRHGASVDLWETRYHQVLEGADPVLEWVKGTALRPVLADLDDTERARFLTAYGEALAGAYPRRPSGETLFPFPRLFIVATAAA